MVLDLDRELSLLLLLLERICFAFGSAGGDLDRLLRRDALPRLGLLDLGRLGGLLVLVRLRRRSADRLRLRLRVRDRPPLLSLSKLGERCRPDADGPALAFELFLPNG